MEQPGAVWGWISATAAGVAVVVGALSTALWRRSEAQLRQAVIQAGVQRKDRAEAVEQLRGVIKELREELVMSRQRKELLERQQVELGSLERECRGQLRALREWTGQAYAWMTRVQALLTGVELPAPLPPAPPPPPDGGGQF